MRRWSETLHEVRRHWFAYLLLAPALALIALLILGLPFEVKKKLLRENAMRAFRIEQRS